MNWIAAREGVSIAIDALRSNKTRAALTVLGIVIGVATVVAMAAILGGFRSSVVGQLEAIGPKNFIIDRWDPSEVRFAPSPGGRSPWEDNQSPTMEEAELIVSLPSIRSVAPAVDVNRDVHYGGRTITGAMVGGRGYQWPDYVQGDFVHGRNFLPSDQHRSAAVAILSSALAESLFDTRNPVGREIRLGSELFTVVGVYRQADNLFADAMENWVLIPPTTAFKRLNADPEWMSLLVVPEAHATQARAIDEVISALRASRGLGPGQENDFSIIRQEAFLELFDRITGVFFLVMLVLSSIGLMVGGVGVVAIMMISVTERTREIGVRKALGATRREILWQFLVESMTVTVVGGLMGLALGGGGAMLLRALTPVPAQVPLWSIVAALLVSAVTGIGFGLYPANKAARLDPVEALRHE